MFRRDACVARVRFTRAPRLWPVFLVIAAAMPAQDRPKRGADGSVERSPLNAETRAVADAFWQKILPRCGESYYYAGSELEIHIHGDRGGAARANNGLTEYAGVMFPPIEPLPISAADKNNGVERKARIFMAASKWRERTPGQSIWQDWVSPPADMNPSDRLKFAVTTIASAPAHFGMGGLMAIELWKVKGQWSYVFPGAIDPMRQRISAGEVTPRKISCDPALIKADLPPKVITASDAVICHDSLNNPVPVQEVRREDAIGWCHITFQRWDELNGKHATTSVPVAPSSSLPSKQMPAVNGVTWKDGDPTFRDGGVLVKLGRSLIVIEQGSTRATFYVWSEGMGIMLAPLNARARETWDPKIHRYVNTDPRSGDATGDYPNGPPLGLMTKLAPFAQVAIKAVDQAKQTPDGARWDDQYFRNALKPYATSVVPSPR